jgi:D-lactate dehydrogenase
MANRTVDALWRWTDGGTLPVVMDATSCTDGLRNDLAEVLSQENRERHEKLEILDSIEWVHDRLLERLEIRRRVPSASLHPTCASQALGLTEQLWKVVSALAEDVHVPAVATCCGFAGDRGLLHPELTASATAEEADEVRRRGAAAHVSSNRTCELGLEQATGAPYVSFLHVLDDATRWRRGDDPR